MVMQQFSDEEFDRFISHPDNAERRFEVIAGEIVEAFSTPYSSQIAGLFVYFLNLFLRERSIGGHITGEAGGYMVMGEQLIGIDGELDGGEVLPGFKLSLKEIFPPSKSEG